MKGRLKMKKKIIMSGLIGLLVFAVATTAFGDGYVQTNFSQTSGTLNVQHTVTPVYSGASNQISATLTAHDVIVGDLTTNFNTQNYWCGDRQVGNQQLNVYNGFSGNPNLGDGMTYIADYTQVSDHPFLATTQTTGNYTATIDNSWQNRGRQNAGANINVSGGGWVTTELDWAASTPNPGTAHAELNLSSGETTGYVEMRTNTEDWGDLTGIPTTYRAFGEIAASGAGAFNVWGQTKNANLMDYKVVGIADGTTYFTSKGDNLGTAFAQDIGNFSTSLDIEDNQQIVKRAWSGGGSPPPDVRTENVGFDIDFNANAKEHFEAYIGGSW